MNGQRRHILRSFDDELEELRGEVIKMGGQVVRSVDQAVAAVISGDGSGCSEVIDDDTVVDRKEMQIDDLGMSILLRHTPVASDLRMVVSSLNITRNLERIGDHAVNIAKRALKIIKAGGCAETSHIEPLFEASRKVVSAALLAYADVDGEGALRVRKMDEEVDQIEKRLSKSFTVLMGEEGAKRDALLHLLFIARSLERIADLAVNIAEDLFYITSAEDIRHS